MFLLRNLNSSLGQVKTYVGSDGKLHFIDASGADSVLNFSKFNSVSALLVSHSNPSTSTINLSVNNLNNYQLIVVTTGTVNSNGSFTSGILTIFSISLLKSARSISFSSITISYINDTTIGFRNSGSTYTTYRIYGMK